MKNEKFAKQIKKMLQEQRQANIETLPDTHFYVNMGINQAFGIINRALTGELCEACIHYDVAVGMCRNPESTYSDNFRSLKFSCEDYDDGQSLKAQILENDRKLRERG